jgi:type II secretory pathway component PulC
MVFGDGVATSPARVTIIAPSKMTSKQAVQLYVDAAEAAGFVVVQKQDTIIVKLGPNMPHHCVAVSDDATLAPRSIQPAAPPAVALDVDANVQRVDDTHVKVTRALVDYVLANPMAFASTMRVVPAVQDGKPSGFKVYAIRPSSLAAMLNLTNGDTVAAINDIALTTVDNALDVIVKVRDAKQIVVDVIRRGKPLKLTITIIAKLPF